ncbi:hypothetical protein [Roseisolibacter sp. H3M3-2]|uniref:hypothetical protein n=1 Tax=Roseisolibacter sp. H3M3-2 TaxID=3031323 RepID=UPI0023DBE0CD|nr:hypothetical protein [Roseisolibacter sp. H3M3-2]MDF1505472.1 hypothetical protein [Roseisolibacter sp. H3M3-2]
MDILVLLEDGPERAPPGTLAPTTAPGDHAGPLAHVNSVAPATPFEGAPREVVTLYGTPDAESLAYALAAAVEGQRAGGDHVGAIRHLGVYAGRGAVGDAAWRDERTGQLLTEDLEIPAARLHETALRLLGDTGSSIRAMVAGLLMPDWPEGVRRAINFSFTPAGARPALAGVGSDVDFLDSIREADGNLFEGD